MFLTEENGILVSKSWITNLARSYFIVYKNNY